MRKGELQQVGPPQELYERPVNLFVAGFIGSPAMNFVQATVVRENGRVAAQFGEQRLLLDDAELALHPGLGGPGERPVILGVRPEHLQDATLSRDVSEERQLDGQVRLRESLGAEVVVHFAVEAAPAVTEEVRELAQDVDSAAVDELEHQRRARRTAFVARFDARTGVREDVSARIAVAPGALRLFDAQTGAALRA
jgi:multiple sugar transport system ATP-binding protein